MTCFLNPRSVAIIGASETNTYSAGILKNLIAHGYEGKLYPINPKRSEVFGVKCYPRLVEVPESIDLVVYCIAREQISTVLAESLQKGAKGILVISAGFAEADEIGKRLQEEIRNFSDSTGIRLVGPNCYGLANFSSRILLTPDKQIDRIVRGNIAMVAQSGALGFCTLLHYGNDRNIGFSKVISTGNEADLQISDFVNDLLSDENTRVMALFMESIKDPKKFAEAAIKAASMGKPIIAMKVGKTEAAAKTALTHTGSITGSDSAYGAFFKKYGVTRVDDLGDLIETSSFFSKLANKDPRNEGIAIITSSGGLASVCADLCNEFGILLPEIEGTVTEDHLLKSGELMAFGKLLNPVDVRGQGMASISKIIKPFLRDDRFGTVVVACAHCGSGPKSKEMANDLIDIEKTTGKIVVALWTGRKTPENSNEETGYEILQKSRVPVFDSPRSCLVAIRSLLDYHRARRNIEAEGQTSSIVSGRKSRSFEKGLMTYDDLFALLSDYNIPVARGKLVHSLEEAVLAAGELGYPVALKVESPQIPHKAEAGGVVLNIGTEAEVRLQYQEIIKNAQSFNHDAKIKGIIVQKMVQDGIETIVGVTQDSQFGPVITFGTGGHFVELFKDVSSKLPPLSRRDSQEMINGLKGSKLLRGFRGRPRADTDSLERVLLGISSLALDYGNEIAELEINPLMALPNG
ncbi:MAG: acetate--CoA ligase family protein, partial [Nitrososphaerales archaeon]